MTQNGADSPSGESPPIGVLLTNLGTPDAPTARALRTYLAEFLWDRRVVDYPRALWWLILHGVILRVRPRRSARLYRTIWTDQGAPLLAISRRQAEELQAELDGRFGPGLKVALGMRYGNPSIASALDELMAAGVERVLVFPLYPQYSCSTTASTFDALAAALARYRRLPELRFINRYHHSPGYLSALADCIREQWQIREPGQKLLFSFHGLPRRYTDEGDPYQEQCLETAREVAARLKLAPERWMVTFQSRFGREEWLQPYTDETLRRLPAEGVRRVDVICPGFAADCLETLEEIAEQNRALFIDAGGEEYRYLPALNDRCDHIVALADVVETHLTDWAAPGAAAQPLTEKVGAETAGS